MVLSPPATDAGAARVPAWLGKLVAQLELARRGVLLALTRATPTQLGTVVRALSKVWPWTDAPAGSILEVCLHAPDLLALRRESRVLVRVGVEELEWLNVNRPVFSDRALRAVLWLDEAAHREMSRRALDLYDWVSRLVEVPDKPVPNFAVENMQAALALGIGIVWRGEDLQLTLAAMGWSGGTVELDAGELHGDLIARLRAPGLPVVAGIRSEADAWRIRMALAHAEREGSWVARAPAVELPGMAVVHDRQADWDEAARRLAEAGRARPELLAAWLDLEPEPIAAACEREGPPDAAGFEVEALATGRAPTWALRGAVTEELREARAKIVALTDAPEDPATLMCWADGREAWRPTEHAIEARMVRALRERQEPTAELVDAARAAGFVGLALELALRRAEAGDEAAVQTVGELAMTLAFVQGRLTAAERALRRGAELAKRIHGGSKLHPLVVELLTTRADVLVKLGQYAEAEHVYREILALADELFGTKKRHPWVAVLLHSLAGVLQAQGDLEGAREKLERSLEIQAEVFGMEDYPSVAASLHSLAGVLQAQGDLEGARGKLERSLEIQAKVYGTEDHPDVAASLHSLAGVLLARGDLEGARGKLERSLEIKAEVFGTEVHPDVAASLHSLAGVLLAQGDLEGARGKLERSLEIQAEVYGTEDHPEVAASLHSLARVLQAQGDLDGAERHYERVLAIEKAVYGTRDHYLTCATEADLAALLLRRGKNSQAIALLEHALPVLSRVLGPNHSWTRQASMLLRAATRSEAIRRSLPYVAHAFAAVGGLPLRRERLRSLSFRVLLFAQAGPAMGLLRAAERGSDSPGLLTVDPAALTPPPDIPEPLCEHFPELLSNVAEILANFSRDLEETVQVLGEQDGLIAADAQLQLPEPDDDDRQALVDECEMAVAVAAQREDPASLVGELELWTHAVRVAMSLGARETAVKLAGALLDTDPGERESLLKAWEGVLTLDDLD